MTTPMSLHPLIMTYFHLLWWQFFLMFVYGDVVYAQISHWPWKTVSSHLHTPVRPMLLQYGLVSFRLFRKNLGHLREFFGQMVYRPPLAKNFPYAYVHMEQNWVEKLCYYRSITVEHYPGFSSVELTCSYIKLLNWRALYYSEDPNMERLSFSYSTKNIPVTPKSEYIRQLIDKTEQFLCRMRWKAYHFINPNQKSGKDTFGLRQETTHRSLRSQRSSRMAWRKSSIKSFCKKDY